MAVTFGLLRSRLQSKNLSKNVVSESHLLPQNRMLWYCKLCAQQLSSGLVIENFLSRGVLFSDVNNRICFHETQNFVAASGQRDYTSFFPGLHWHRRHALTGMTHEDFAMSNSLV